MATARKPQQPECAQKAEGERELCEQVDDNHDIFNDHDEQVKNVPMILEKAMPNKYNLQHTSNEYTTKMIKLAALSHIGGSS
eukprot:CAMPEP_0170219518 /NCGR_PEP_ID=MMETSP0116_2-20130129/9440_1 /TAXON_ID=400756 /ORGANISM="Durinskia baltica, Strain CSIRO CS-38" /LENGTH=81 /DNA_ID=CAMNT_0010470183 /DNA_START=33 /DNA_END=276 /DNA_ORIENTATION=-